MNVHSFDSLTQTKQTKQTLTMMPQSQEASASILVYAAKPEYDQVKTIDTLTNFTQDPHKVFSLDGIMSHIHFRVNPFDFYLLNHMPKLEDIATDLAIETARINIKTLLDGSGRTKTPAFLNDKQNSWFANLRDKEILLKHGVLSLDEEKPLIKEYQSLSYSWVTSDDQNQTETNETLETKRKQNIAIQLNQNADPNVNLIKRSSVYLRNLFMCNQGISKSFVVTMFESCAQLTVYFDETNENIHICDSKTGIDLMLPLKNNDLNAQSLYLIMKIIVAHIEKINISTKYNTITDPTLLKILDPKSQVQLSFTMKNQNIIQGLAYGQVPKTPLGKAAYKPSMHHEDFAIKIILTKGDLTETQFTDLEKNTQMFIMGADCSVFHVNFMDRDGFEFNNFQKLDALKDCCGVNRDVFQHIYNNSPKDKYGGVMSLIKIFVSSKPIDLLSFMPSFSITKVNESLRKGKTLFQSIDSVANALVFDVPVYISHNGFILENFSSNHVFPSIENNWPYLFVDEETCVEKPILKWVKKLENQEELPFHTANVEWRNQMTNVVTQLSEKYDMYKNNDETGVKFYRKPEFPATEIPSINSGDQVSIFRYYKPPNPPKTENTVRVSNTDSPKVVYQKLVAKLPEIAEYANNFINNAINGEAFYTLSNGDLKDDLGIGLNRIRQQVLSLIQ
jgi:hypothetical protein